MAKVIVLYNPPQDPAHFEHYYYKTHAPLACTIPGLRRYEVSHGPITTMQGPAPYHLIATLTFDSMADIQAALASPQGQAAAADLPNFATGGVTLLFMDSRDIPLLTSQIAS